MNSSPALRRSLGDYGAYLFDVDGTLIYPNSAVPGASEAVFALKQAGKQVFVVTNNSMLAPEEHVARLRAFGIPIEQRDIMSALVAAAQHVARERPGARVFVLGEPSLKRECRRHGLTLVEEDAPVEYVIVGTDREITYRRFVLALRGLLRGARFVAVNVDRLIATEEGLIPGAALFVGALRAAADREPDVIVGKPSTVLLEEALARAGLAPQDCLFIGDSLASDVLGAQAMGMPAALVLSGVTTREQLARSPVQPDYVLESVVELVAALQTGRT
jgi:4-nitrophenyl phosphatase